MPAKKQWDEEDDDSSTPPSSPPLAASAARRGKFADEEGDDSDILDSWDAAEDSEVEREKAKKAAETKAKAAAVAPPKKSKKDRIAQHRANRAAEESEGSDDEETPAQLRERLNRAQMESDLNHAADLFGDIGVSNSRKATTVGAAVPVDPNDPTKTIDLSSLPLLNPTTKLQFENTRNTLVPILSANSKKAHYVLFLQEFTKQLAKDLPSDHIKKIASTLTALGNEKMKEEKAADKGGKKSKAQKTKTSVVTTRANTVDVGTYEDAFGDDDFM